MLREGRETSTIVRDSRRGATLGNRRKYEGGVLLFRGKHSRETKIQFYSREEVGGVSGKELSEGGIEGSEEGRRAMQGELMLIEIDNRQIDNKIE